MTKNECPPTTLADWLMKIGYSKFESSSIQRILVKNHIRTISDLMETPTEILAMVKGIGPKRIEAIRKVKAALRKRDLISKVEDAVKNMPTLIF